MIPEFPKFYIKAVGGKFSLEHRLTHTTVSSVDTEEELYEELERWNEMPDEELWKFLLYRNYARIVQPKDFDTVFKEQEDWYFKAWGIYTSRFYENNPELLVTVNELPMELLNRMRKEKNDEEQARYRQNRLDIEEREKELQSRTKEERKEKKSGRDKIVEEDDNVTIGDTKKLEKVIRRKKAKKKIKIRKKKPNELFNLPEVSDNPFD